jgi:hypothetical protein
MEKLMNIPQDQRDALLGLQDSADEQDSQHATAMLDIIADIDSGAITAEQGKAQLTALNISSGMAKAFADRLLAD